MSHVLNRGVLVPASSLQVTGTADGTKFLRDDGSWQSVGGGTGDVVGQASSVDSEVALFSGTGGKTIKRATGSGIAKLTSGVLSTATAGTDYYQPTGTDVAITDGGTGVSTLPSGLLKGAGTGAITAGAAGTDYVAPGGALGTPSSGTLTNCTGLPIAGLTSSTSTAVGVGTVELGHASDTTLARASAGQLTVEGVNVLMNGGALGTPSSGTLTNATGLPIAGLVNSTSAALGLGTIELGHASDTTIARSGAGDITVEGNAVYRAGGTDVPVADGGTGRSTSTTAYGLIAAGTTATGAHQTLAAGATTDILVGGGASALPAWTTATGSGAPVRATSPALVTPTGIVKGDVGLGNVDNTSDATKNSATATLTNKRVTPRVGTTTSSATPTINTDNVDAYSITAQAAAITSFTTNLSGTPTDFQRLLIRIKDDGTARAITWGASFEAGSVALPTTTTLSKTLLVGFIYDSVDSKWACEASGSRP